MKITSSWESTGLAMLFIETFIANIIIHDVKLEVINIATYFIIIIFFNLLGRNYV